MIGSVGKHQAAAASGSLLRYTDTVHTYIHMYLGMYSMYVCTYIHAIV